MASTYVKNRPCELPARKKMKKRTFLSVSVKGRVGSLK